MLGRGCWWMLLGREGKGSSFKTISWSANSGVASAGYGLALSLREYTKGDTA